jgi:hypothetical protein
VRPGTFYLKQHLLESDTVLKCIFCILSQLRHTSEKPWDEPFQNCNRICHAHPLWFTMGFWRMTLRLANRQDLTQVWIHMPKCHERSTVISLLPVRYWSLHLLLWPDRISDLCHWKPVPEVCLTVVIPLEMHDFLQGLVWLGSKTSFDILSKPYRHLAAINYVWLLFLLN